MRLIVFATLLALASTTGERSWAQVFPGRDLGWPRSTAQPATVGYRGIVVSSAVRGSEPAAGQLRAYPLVQGPLAVAGVPGDRSGVFVPPYSPDVTYLGPNRHTAGYAGWGVTPQRRLFPPPPGGSGLPLVTDGGFSYGSVAAMNDALTPPYAGYYGTVTPVYASPPGSTPSTFVPSGP